MKKLIFLLLTVFSVTAGIAQTEVGGVTLPNTVTFQDATLTLNGAGVREKFWMDMYSSGLYLESKSADAKAILAADKPMALKLHIVSKLITSSKMIDAVNEGFENSTKGKTAALKQEIAQFISFFEEPITKNDIFDLVYLPGKGVVVYKNGIEKGTIKGLEFKKAMFGIWLSEKPADEDLKEALLKK